MQKSLPKHNETKKTGGRLVIKPTRRQVEGGFLETLASIGIPTAVRLVTKMSGSGLQIDSAPSSNTKNVYVSPETQGEGYPLVPYRSPPFFGTWEDQMKTPIGMGVKGKKKKAQRQRTASWRRTTIRIKKPIQRNPHIRGHFIIKPLSNFDLMDWVKRLGIEHFRGMYSRDGLPRKSEKNVG